MITINGDRDNVLPVSFPTAWQPRRYVRFSPPNETVFVRSDGNYSYDVFRHFNEVGTDENLNPSTPNEVTRIITRAQYTRGPFLCVRGGDYWGTPSDP